MGAPKSQYHDPLGEPCAYCGEPREAHRRIGRYGPTTRQSRKPYSERVTFIGIDGEGKTIKHHSKCQRQDCRGCLPIDPKARSYPHIYTFLAAVSEHGQRWFVENPTGLSTDECLEFITSLPAKPAKLVSYSFGYDLTKILEDLPNWMLFKLLRPELRRPPPKYTKMKSLPVWWPKDAARYTIDMLSTKTTIRKIDSRGNRLEPHVINDIWKFFQGKFVSALEDWKIGTPEMRERMRLMKDKRSEFDKLDNESIREYCFEECQCMAELARKLTEAHRTAGIPLKSYYGAGSSADAMMRVMGVKTHVAEARATNMAPEELAPLLAMAFFGGRFENSVVGPMDGPLWSYDISSAYPYQLCFLPCLIHGKWQHTDNRYIMEGGRTAIVRYRLHAPEEKDPAWAPFPFRLKDGSICFPAESGGGWVWRDEYLAGERLFENVEFREAWVYRCECSCSPFERIPEFYRQRVLLGKEGPGIVLKLGCNSCYGKTAQSSGGGGAYTNWVWCGMITSGCRAQVLEALGSHRDRRNLLMVATDGIASRERLVLPQPRETGTGGLLPCPVTPETPDGHLATPKPLGGWEETELPNGQFYARPGVYFQLNPTEKHLKKIRGRGVGRETIYKNWEMIVRGYEDAKAAGKLETAVVHVRDLSRFIGSKSAISRAGVPGRFRYSRSPEYGQWILRPVEMSFNPAPKRQRVRSNGTLELRRFPGEESAAYDRSVVSADAAMMRAAQAEAEEQPDLDLTDYEMDEFS